jgi:uncharacterized membrane protein YccC
LNPELISDPDGQSSRTSQRISEAQQQIAEVQSQLVSLREEMVQRREEDDERIRRLEGACKQSWELAEAVRQAFLVIARGISSLEKDLCRHDRGVSPFQVVDVLHPRFSSLEQRVAGLERQVDEQRNSALTAAIRRIVEGNPPRINLPVSQSPAAVDGGRQDGS